MRDVLTYIQKSLEFINQNIKFKDNQIIIYCIAIPLWENFGPMVIPRINKPSVT